MKRVLYTCFFIFIAVVTSLVYRYVHEDLILINNGDTSFHHDDYPKAAHYYSLAIQKGARSDYAFSQLEDAFLLAAQSDKIMTLYLSLTKEFPHDTPLLHQVGKFYVKRDLFENAKEVYKKILTIHPDDAFARLWLARILTWSGDFNEALYNYNMMLHP
jgi:tetratricopeptide (TPR) repeat protein